MAYVQLTQDQIRAREQLIVDRFAKLKKDPYPAILADRKQRFKDHVDAMTIRPEIAMWAQSMATAHGRKVRVHNNVTNWTTALMIVRYGEAEYYWPMEFTDEDVQRATEMEVGQFGEAITLITKDTDED